MRTSLTFGKEKCDQQWNLKGCIQEQTLKPLFYHNADNDVDGPMDNFDEDITVDAIGQFAKSRKRYLKALSEGMTPIVDNKHLAQLATLSRYAPPRWRWNR